MRKFTHNPQPPITIERLVEIAKAMEPMSRKDAYKFGNECGISRHNVDSIRQMLGYSHLQFYKHKTPEEREQIAEEYREGGKSINEIAKKYGLAPNSIRCILLNRDVTITTSKKWDRRQEMFLTKELKKGTPTKAIARMLGKKQHAIQQKIIRMRIDNTIVDELENGTSVERIAEMVGLSVTMTENKIKMIKREQERK